MSLPDGLVRGEDGLLRCGWSASSPLYRDYHDTEWGRPLHGDRDLFERLSLEAFQSGLSWLVILRKRQAFREAFAAFDPAVVARFGPAEVERLCADPAIVRNRRKIVATIANARVVVGLEVGLGELLWSFAPPEHARPRTVADVATTTPESAAMAADLRRRGLSFVGPTTCHALMQATGMVDDHLLGCQVPVRTVAPDAQPGRRPARG